MAKGILYGVGVGPGDPKLLTLRALEVIAACPVIAAPRTRNGGMVALEIVRGAADLSGKTVLPLDFAMSPDADERAASHRAAADALRQVLDRGLPVAMLNLGDVSIYASYRYLADILGPEGYPLEMIPGVTSFSAAACVLGSTLTDMTTPLYIIPDGSAESEEVFARAGASVFMKSGRHLPRLLAQLGERDLLRKCKVVQNCGMPNERVYEHPESAAIDGAYFTIVILKNGRDGETS